MTTNINIISGFLGAGKTSLLKKIIPKMKGKVVLIENEFGDVSIDGDLMDNQLPIREIYAGCICCSVAQDFERAIEELALEYKPHHILIEPSGVGSLSDVIKVCKRVSKKSDLDIKINHVITIVDVRAFEDYLENFGGFYLDQIKNANLILLSYFDQIDGEELEKIIAKIRENNQGAFILNRDWYSCDGESLIGILNSIENCEVNSIEEKPLIPATRVFSSLSFSEPRIFPLEELDKMLASLKHQEQGYILRAKGILELDNKQFIHFNYTPHHYSWEYLVEAKGTKVAVIGTNLKKDEIKKLFNK